MDDNLQAKCVHDGAPFAAASYNQSEPPVSATNLINI